MTSGIQARFNINAGTAQPRGFKQKFWSTVNDLGLMSQQQRNNKFYEAAWDRDLNALALWHQAGAQINGNSNRAVKFATGRGSEECVQYLLDNGARPNETLSTWNGLIHPVDQTTALDIAASMGRTELLDRLVVSYPPEARSEPLQKALDSAIDNNHKDTVKHLLEVYKDAIGLEKIRYMYSRADTKEMKDFLMPFAMAARNERTPAEESALQHRLAVDSMTRGPR